MHLDLSPDDVITTAELRARGVTHHAIAVRCRPSGPWQRMLRGVVLMSSNRPTRRQRLRAAIAYAGQEAVVSSVDAMRAHGVDVPPSPDVLVLTPARRRLVSCSYLTVERTARLPRPVVVTDLPYAPLVRATLDTARRAADHDQLCGLLTAVMGQCSVAELRAELDAGNQRGSAEVRALLTEELAYAGDVVSETVTLAKRTLRMTRLPPPRWQVPLHDDTGMFLGVPDAWWPEVSLAWDVGPQSRHHDPRTWAAAGITLLRTDPELLRTNPAAALTELMVAFTKASAGTQRRAS